MQTINITKLLLQQNYFHNNRMICTAFLLLNVDVVTGT